MTQAAPLLLLLPLLLMGIWGWRRLGKGSQGEVLPVKYQEGQTLRVSCIYHPWTAEKSWKTWCKLEENGRWCERIITRNSVDTAQLTDLRVSLVDDTYTGTITITMSNLRVKDSGIYWCGIYDSVRSGTLLMFSGQSGWRFLQPQHRRPTNILKLPLTHLSPPLPCLWPPAGHHTLLLSPVPQLSKYYVDSL
uniref:Trem-like transcript 2 protein n=1 Tax=Phascolarctos cinereus TaxID=38626 RepID=A0A6P5LEE3_PHACI|nr:trem-like transcript 2 protein [Phascolarctos cinereus]